MTNVLSLSSGMRASKGYAVPHGTW
jgi:hypothetical protein